MKRDVQSIMAKAMAEADQAFADHGDVMSALSFVALAAQTGTPLPPRIGRWVYDALNDYGAGKKPTMDAALGLAQARRKLKSKSALQGALARMMVLHILGATIDQAASLVARLDPQFTLNTLADRYRRSRLGAKALAQRGEARHRWHITEVRSMLAEYPNTPTEAAQAKAAILAMWPDLALWPKLYAKQ